MAGYLVLTLLLAARAAPLGRGRRRPGRDGRLALAYAVSDEWHQSFVPAGPRRREDVAIDGIGIALAALAGTRTRVRELTA